MDAESAFRTFLTRSLLEVSVLKNINGVPLHFTVNMHSNPVKPSCIIYSSHKRFGKLGINKLCPSTYLGVRIPHANIAFVDRLMDGQVVNGWADGWIERCMGGG